MCMNLITFGTKLSIQQLMWILLIVAAFIAALFLIMAIIGFSQPRVATLERSILINADSNTVFPVVSNLREFVTWSPWSDKDPNMQQTFTGMDGTVGSVYSWKGNNKVGEGKMEITAIQPGKQTDVSIDFGNRGKALSGWVLEKAGDQTKVTWKFESDMGSNPIMRCAQPIMKKFIGKDYEAGLINLKRKIESGGTAAPSTPVYEDGDSTAEPATIVMETPEQSTGNDELPGNENKETSHIAQA